MNLDLEGSIVFMLVILSPVLCWIFMMLLTVIGDLIGDIIRWWE